MNAAMSDPVMIPIGYMLKDLASPVPEWVGGPNVTTVHSLSNCVSSDFGDYIPLWQHNGWWLFDTAEKVRAAATSMGKLLGPLKLFYYEAFHQQFDDATATWGSFEPEDFPTDVVPPCASTLSGFDVVTFYVGTSPECSPLSCNGLATLMAVNQRCLFDSFSEAVAALEGGSFRETEPGPYRIIAVYSVDDDA